MKLLIYISILFPFFIQQQLQLNGKYRMEYEENYTSQNGTIEFKNTSYQRKLSNGKTVTGLVVYQDFVIQLKDDKFNLQMDFSKRDIQLFEEFY